jgi:hypothetical protein
MEPVNIKQKPPEQQTNQQNQNSNFLSGLEELVARLISLVLITAMFAVYSAGKSEPLQVESTKLILILLLYWFAYEVVSFVFFMILKRFSSSNQYQNIIVVEKNQEISTSNTINPNNPT